jgi:DNA-binding Xre family transcriptional regulator
MFELEKIKKVLESKGRSVQWLADQLGYKNPAVYKLINTNSTSTKTLEKICELLSITPLELLSDDITKSLKIESPAEWKKESV